MRVHPLRRVGSMTEVSPRSEEGVPSGGALAADLDAKTTALVEHLAGLGPLAVAVSGGVDSSFLLAAALRAERDVLPLLGVSPTLPQEARARAHRIAETLGVVVREVETHELEDPSYVANGPDRCYFCKKELFGVLKSLDAVVRSDATGEGRALLDGTQHDDRGDTRPGRRAARELGVSSPLLDLGWTKADIRIVSRHWGLETWNLPSGPCLSSRVPTGIAVTEPALRRIEAGERALRDLGFLEVRVRDHGSLARVELPSTDLPRAVEFRDEIAERLEGIGYLEVTLDLRGYRPAGSSRRARANGDRNATSSQPIDRSEV